MDNFKNEAMDSPYELMDDELKGILGKRYQDESHLFTPEAQERRRNNRVVFTIRITAFMIVLMFGVRWANSVGIFTSEELTFWVSICSIVIGYNAGICVSHLKGWRD